MICEENCWLNIAKILKCPTCTEIFEDPKLLSCGHRFCKNCLIINSTNLSNNISAHCPTCSKAVNYITCKNTELLCKVMLAEKKLKEAPSSVDAFELLLPVQNRRKWNVNKTYFRKKKIANNDVRTLPFQDAGAKEMIIRWLSNTQNKFERATQSQEIYDFCEDDNNSFSLPSVSQNNNKSTLNATKREYIHLRSRKVKRPHSLDLKRTRTQNKATMKRTSLSFNTSCNYNIEEFDTGPTDMENPSIQKNIIQHLEDDFLDSIETEVDITKYNSRINNCDSNVPDSGWDRMKQMKKSVCKTNKKAKKLKTVQINASFKINDTKTDSVKNLRSRSKSRENCKNINSDVALKDLHVDKKNKAAKFKNKTTIKKSDVPNEIIAKINEGRQLAVLLDKEIILNHNLLGDYSKNCNNNESFRKSALKLKHVDNLDVEIIDLTVASPKEKSIATSKKNVENNCEIIIRNIAKIKNNERGSVKSKNAALKTTKNRLSLNLPLNTTQETVAEVIPALDTPKIANARNNDEILIQECEKENVIDDIFLIDTQIINIDENNLNNSSKGNLIGVIGVPLTNKNFNNDIFLMETQKTADPADVEVRNRITLELDKIQKLIQNCTDYNLELKNILKFKFNDILQLIENNFCVDNSKICQSVGIQTIQNCLQDAFVQTTCAMENIDVQTDFLDTFVKSTQTSEVLISEKCLQTSQSGEITIDVQVQVDEKDLRTSPQEKIINGIVEKFLASQESVKNRKRNSQCTARREVNINEDFDTYVANLENNSLSEKRTKFRETEELDIKKIAVNNFDRSPKEDDLNVAILLTESEKTFSKPNSPAKKTQNSTQVESIGIISQTQPNKNFHKITRPKTYDKNSAPIESIGIVSQTQINRSPMKLNFFKAKLAAENSASPEKKSPEQLFRRQCKNVEFSDSFENFAYNTAEILAGGEVSYQKKPPSVVKTPSDVSNIQISVDKVHRKLDFDRSSVRRMKRIRFPDDTDSDEDQPQPKKRSKNKFVRDDLSVEFQTEGNLNSDDNLLPEDLPDICDNDLDEDFNLEDCLRNIERKFDSNSGESESLKNPPVKPSTTKFVVEKDNKIINNIHITKADDAILFKSPKRPKQGILSEIICANETKKSPATVTILDDIIIQAPNKEIKTDIDLDEVIYSDESFEENTKLHTAAIWATPTKDNFLDVLKIPLGETPDMFNLPSEGEEVVLAPPLEFANSDVESKCKFTENRSAQDPQIDSAVILQDNPIDISKQPEEVPNYDILSLSPIEPPEDKANFALSIKKLDKPRAKPLNISHHSTPKVKQNTLFSYLKRTQNRTHLNTSSSSLFQETEDLMKRNSQNDSRTIAEISERKFIPCIACSRLNKDDVIAVTSLVRKKLSTFKNSYDMSVTHMIVSVNKDNMVKDHTMKYILAVSAGIWILNAEWVKECVKNNDIVAERPFEVFDVFGAPGPKESRLYREIKPLLAEFRIYASPPFRTTEKSVIEDVIRNMGGTVAENPNNFLNKGSSIDLVITEASSTQSFLINDDWLNVYQVATVDIEWLSRSVGQFKVLSFLPFLLCDVDEIQDLNVYPEKYLDNIPGFTFSTQ